MDDYTFLNELKAAKKDYRESSESRFGVLKATIQKAIVDGAKQGKTSVSVLSNGFPQNVINDVVDWFKSLGMDAKHYTGDQRDPANEIQVRRF